MAKIFKVFRCWLAVTFMIGTTLVAQGPDESRVPPAPVPAQILAAKRVFISNAPGEIFYAPRNAEDDPYRPYNQFYASLKSWGYYELVSAPADADLILEIKLSARALLNNAMVQGELHQAHLDLTLRDPKTQVVLWWLAERMQGANRPATGEKNYNQAMTSLVNDMKKLVGQSAAASNDTKK